ncbi:hypothetical protein [Pantoea phytobeneficialis]|uniref:Uncharacterized protein n=1 Tax=Pantoea phytobeneficialis TaxID=2052056 RepID=A0AAP9KS03_9GAMM|nr:hypothetical protein [Pantoea phytobeneficialis]QGR09568.1 hypothetical protein CTZ24_24175 [Pantoea phytobeneficialis]
MKRISLALLFFPIASWAACFGSDAYQTCNDNSGNTYHVQRFGNTTNVQGSNMSTGNNWSQSSTSYGNQTETHGTAANGNTWNSTTTSYGNGNYSVHGRDTNGNYFSKNCNRFGCN